METLINYVYIIAAAFILSDLFLKAWVDVKDKETLSVFRLGVHWVFFRKPFICAKCLGFWISLVYSFQFGLIEAIGISCLIHEIVLYLGRIR